MLFLVFINDLNHAVKCDINMFADDTTISTVVSSINPRFSIVHSLNEDLHEVELWAEKWLVIFNARKPAFANQ